jgi:hypothetical protein
VVDPDRLRALRHQRSLVAGHLAWLDQEIDRSSGGAKPASPLTTASPSVPTTPARQPAPPPEELISQWAEQDQSVEPLISKTGCWLVFAAAILLILGAVVTFIVVKY